LIFEIILATINRFEDLGIWQESRELCKWVALKSKVLARHHLYRLKDQIEGSSGSTMDNIAEGFERSGRKEFIQYLIIAKGSVGEFRSQIYRMLDNGIISETEAELKINETFTLNKRIGGFIKYLKNSDYDGWKLKEPDPEYFSDDDTDEE
jgi:four helix bundle protein